MLQPRCHAMDSSCCMSCTEQLWSMSPIFDAPWMNLQLKDDLQRSERYLVELESKNIELNRELGVFLLQMHIAREDLEKVRAGKRELEALLESGVREAQELRAGREALSSQLDARTRELQDLRVELALLRGECEQREEQEQLAVEIWGPANRRKPDATWDPPAVLLFARRSEKDCPLTVGRVAADLGFKCSPRALHLLGSHVRDAFMRAHGREPVPRVFYDKNGAADRIGCFTERDRELIAGVLRAHAELGVD